MNICNIHEYIDEYTFYIFINICIKYINMNISIYLERPMGRFSCLHTKNSFASHEWQISLFHEAPGKVSHFHGLF